MMSLLHAAATADTLKPYTPSPGTAERTAILNGLRGEKDWYFIVHELRVIHAAKGNFAYANVSLTEDSKPRGDFGGPCPSLLQLKENGRWKLIWGESSGGANSYKDGIAYYEAVIQYLRNHDVDPNSLAPSLLKTLRDARRVSNEELNSVGFGDFKNFNFLVK
ncbi:MAG: hypothetical protein LBF16_07040 [Pseudomonadales bacterium]|jgi:hypothetical protein|nr:hypothetical protein [Pseudomonadales bacterium]